MQNHKSALLPFRGIESFQACYITVWISPEQTNVSTWCLEVPFWKWAIVLEDLFFIGIKIIAGLIVATASVFIKDHSTPSYQVIGVPSSVFLNLLFFSPTSLCRPPPFSLRGLQAPYPWRHHNYTILLMRDKMGFQPQFNCNTESIVDIWPCIDLVLCACV